MPIPERTQALRPLQLLPALGAGAVLLYALLSLPEAQPLTGAILANASELSNPVTAVLLDFRGYDTLLEVTVLLVAVLSGRAAGCTRKTPVTEVAPVVTHGIAMLVPLGLLLAGYLLWAGADRPGGAFQGGAIAAGLLVLCWLGGQWRPSATLSSAERGVLVAGPASFAAAAAVLLFTGTHLLDYPATLTGEITLLIESVILVSVAAALGTLFAMEGKE